MPRLHHPRQILALVLLACVLLSGCGGGGAPTRAAGEFGVQIHNDTGNAVQVQLCERWSKERDCRSFFEDDPPSQDLAAGSRATVLVHAETKVGKGNAVPGTIRLVDPKTTDEVGCIPYRITTAPTGAATPRFDVSQAHACADSSRVEPKVVAAK
ncbi:MAG: hypothetical protein H7287_00935 [Thermoleophilia bacterium]|nr:hypothetical protein [Thermoleophilia bacterium]